MSRKWHPPQSVLQRGLDGLRISDVSRETVATSARFVFDSGPSTEPLVPPIYHTSTYKLKTVDDYLKILDETLVPYIESSSVALNDKKLKEAQANFPGTIYNIEELFTLAKKGGYIYSRLNNFTSDAVQAAINDIEGGKGTLVFNTGMSAAMTALFCFLKSGDHVVMCNPVYSGVYDIAVNMFPKYNIEVTFVPSGCQVSEYEKNIKSNTKMLYGETPCNPNMAILDLDEFGKLGVSKGILTMVDGTFASPYLQQAIKYQIDISMHSCTKYMGGHSDLTAGSLTFRSVELWQTMIRYQTTFGSSLSPHEASLLLRGLKTLPLRMERHSSNAQKVAEFLEKHPKVENVAYPGLKSHPGHNIAAKQMDKFSGMMSVEIKGGMEGGRIFVEGLRLIQLAVSLGGVESLAEHPATMTHGPMLMSDEDRLSGGITNGMVRISIGIEDPQDLINDVSQALDKIPDSVIGQ